MNLYLDFLLLLALLQIKRNFGEPGNTITRFWESDPKTQFASMHASHPAQGELFVLCDI